MVTADQGMSVSPGPLSSLTVVELAGIGPAPFAGMLLADLGANVVRVDRPGTHAWGLPPAGDLMGRGRRSVAVDLKTDAGAALVRDLTATADVALEGFRPGVAERLGVGPDECRAANPRLVYGRMTGWGQEGPWAGDVGHDLLYLAIAGPLGAMGHADRPPTPPLNLVADFGGGGMLLLAGILAALVERGVSGQGQVVDAAMVDGVAAQTALFHGLAAVGAWRDEREANLLDGGAPFYRCYACADDRFVAVAALEPEFYAALLHGLGLDPAAWPQHDQARWPEQHAELAEIFARRTRDEWADHFSGSDACVVPVLSLTEAPTHPHLAARGTYVARPEVAGWQPAAAPRLSRTPGAVPPPPPQVGAHTEAVLTELGRSAEEIASLRADGVVG